MLYFEELCTVGLLCDLSFYFIGLDWTTAN